VRTFADHLGDEVVLVVVGKDRGRVAPIVLAEVRKDGLRETIEDELAAIAVKAAGGPVVRIVEDGPLDTATGERADLFVLLRSGIVAVTPDHEALREVAAALQASETALDKTPFGARIAEAYRGGVGVLFAADLEKITAEGHGRLGRDRPEHEKVSRAGFDGVRHLIVEHDDTSGHGAVQAVLAFEGVRRGIPSWLAAPAPMGSLDFVSSNAQAAAAFVFKTPSLVLDDLVALASIGRPQAESELAELQSELGLDIRGDVAEALGAEFVVALDGPLLPTPAWKLVMEVYDPARLQHSLQVIVSKANDEASRRGRLALRLDSEQVGSETYYTLGGPLPVEIHYAFADGYVVAAPSRALVMRALQTRRSGETLGTSAAFRALFPPGRDLHVSGLVYQNLGAVLRSFVEAPVPLSPDQRRSLAGLTGDARPTLLCAYGEDDAIRLAGMGGVFDLDASQLALPMLLERAVRGTAGRPQP
jgi:hypothetical protein